MKVTEVAQNPSVQFEEAIRGNLTVKSVARKQYLESARGHYVSALAGRNTEKQEQTNTPAIVGASSVAADQAFDQAAEAEEPATPEQPEQLKTSVEKDVQMQFHKGFFKGSEQQLQAVKMHFRKTLSRRTATQLADVANRLGVIRKEMGRLDAPDLEAMTTVSSDFDTAKDSLLKEMLESSSLKKTVESLKAELENLKREHAELKDNDAGAEPAAKNCQLMPFHCKPVNESCLSGKAKCRHVYEEVAQNKNETEVLNIKAEGLKRVYNSLKSCVEVEKRPRTTLDINEAKESRMSALDLCKSLPGRMYTTCVSTSESSARVMNSEDELESSSQQPEKSNNLEGGKLMVIKGRTESNKHDRASEFSIRDYVFSARNKNISTNWPFSQKNLQLCLKHGVKNVLPPLQPVCYLRDGSVRRCLAEKSVSSEESNLNERPSVRKRHPSRGSTIDCRWNQELVDGYKDLNSFPSVGEQDLAFQTTAAVCQSEVGSVSTSNLPLSEAVSGEQEAAASAANKTKSSVSQIFDKKSRVALKLPINRRRGAPEDITSACTVPSEAMASKICPVCESFSSSSNTTLNAHIDQCLSSKSSPNWVKNSKLVNPRIKSRKMRSMADICATAPRCTLEDLDKRNGSNWATNVDIPSEDTGLGTEESNHRVLSRYTVNKLDDGSVYIDSNGRKIRILSKLNETAPTSFLKPREDPKERKKSKKGKICKLFSASRKRRLVKHLKYLRVTRQRKHFLSLKVKGRSAKASAAEEATCAGHESHMEHQPLVSFGEGPKVQEQKNYIASETSSRCTPFKKISMTKKNDPETTTKVCRYDLRVRNDHTVNGRTPHKKHSHLPKKPLCSIQHSLRTSACDSAGAEQKSPSSSCEKTMGSPPPRSEIQGNMETFLAPLKLRGPGFNGKNPKECVWTFMDSGTIPVSSFGREIEIQPDGIHGSRKMLHSCHAYSFEEMRSCNSEPGILSPNLSYAGEPQSISKLKGSAVENSYGRSRNEETEAWSTDSGEQSGAKQVCSQDDLGDTNRYSDCADGGQDKYCFSRSAETRHDNKDFDYLVSSIGLAVRETDIRLNPSLVPELQKVADVSVPLSKTMQCTNKFQSPLSRVESKAYRDVSAAARSELKMGNGNFSFGQGSSLVEIDPILIPGPPGSDLPSFSDMGSEGLQRTSSSSTSLEQSFGDEDNVVNGDSPDSPLSATSTVFNLGVADDCVFPGWLVASSPVDTLTVFSQSSPAKTERVASAVYDLKEGPARAHQCCCSRKEGIPWSAPINFPESQLQGHRMASLVTFPGEQLTDSTLTKWPYNLDDSTSFSTFPRIEPENLVNSVENSHHNIMSLKISAEAAVRSHRTGDCDSASPAPILRLMGKDLMVVNKEEDNPSLVRAAQNACMNRQVHPVTETSSKLDRIWEYHSSHNPALMGPLLYEQDPHIFSVQCFNVGPSNTIDTFGNPNYTSGDMYVDKHMHSSFSVLGAAPLQS